MKIKILLVCMLLGVTGLSACASPATPSLDVPTAASTLELPLDLSVTEAVAGTGEPGFYPLSTRVGVADVDAVLAAVESGDPQQLRDLLRFTSVNCTTADGLGGPPKCQDDEVDGTPVEVLPFLGPEGNFLHKANVDDFPGVNVIGVYAVYRNSDTAYSEEAYPVGEYAILLKAEENQPNVILQVRSGIVRIDYLFPPTSLDEIVERDAAQMILIPQQ